MDWLMGDSFRLTLSGLIITGDELDASYDIMRNGLPVTTTVSTHRFKGKNKEYKKFIYYRLVLCTDEHSQCEVPQASKRYNIATDTQKAGRSNVEFRQGIAK
jgi:hypothetical protein